MIRTTAVRLAVVLAVPLAAAAQPPAGATPAPAAAASSQKRTKAFDLDLEAATYGGAFDGEGVRRQSGGLAVVEVKAKPQIYGHGWFLDVPFRVAHRQTFGTDLVETRGSLDLEPWYQATKRLRLGLEAGAAGASRPDWPDLYQRTDTGYLPPTDRYGYFAWRGGARLYARPAAHQHLRVNYRYVDYDYREDPNFDPAPNTGDVMHLTPRDRTEHQVDTSWRYNQERWDLAFRFDYIHREYDTLLARNRRSGATPEDGAGVELNPQQKLDKYQPSVELDLVRMNGRLEISLGYGLDVWNDPYQGYYSLTAHTPGVKAKLALTGKLRTEIGLQGWYATFTSDGSTRLDGTATKRKDSRTTVRGELDYRLTPGLSLQAGVRFVSRSTNYTDFTPDPATNAGFDIAFDYTNFEALAGIRYKL